MIGRIHAWRVMFDPCLPVRPVAQERSPSPEFRQTISQLFSRPRSSYMSMRRFSTGISWLRRVFARTHTPIARSMFLRLEILEDRLVPSTAVLLVQGKPDYAPTAMANWLASQLPSNATYQGTAIPGLFEIDAPADQLSG